MVTAECFAGNQDTGFFIMRRVFIENPNDVYGACEEITDDLLDLVGREGGKWAVYTDGKETKDHVADFMGYMQRVRESQ